MHQQVGPQARSISDILLSPRPQRFGAVPAIRIRDNLDRAVDSWCQNARRTYDVRGPWGSRHAQDGERMGLAPPWYFETMKSTLLTMDKRNPPRPRSANKRDVTTKEGSPRSGVGIVSTRILRGAERKEAAGVVPLAPLRLPWIHIRGGARYPGPVRTKRRYADTSTEPNSCHRLCPCSLVSLLSSPHARGLSVQKLDVYAQRLCQDCIATPWKISGKDRRSSDPFFPGADRPGADSVARIISKRTNGPSRHVRFQPAGDDQQSQPYLVTTSSRVAGYRANKSIWCARRTLRWLAGHPSLSAPCCSWSDYNLIPISSSSSPVCERRGGGGDTDALEAVSDGTGGAVAVAIIPF